MKNERKITGKKSTRIALLIPVATLVAGLYTIPVFADEDSQALEEIVVTGSYVARKNQASMSSPIQILGSEAISRTGFAGIDDLLVLNTANIGSVGGTQDLVGGVADNRASRSANLRGLGPASTLVLLNGRRVASQEQDRQRNNYVNLAALVPTIAVRQIETVLDGASAIYGSDAIAGVMNIITDDTFKGLDMMAQYTFIEDAPAQMYQVKLGGGGDRFHGVVSVSYEKKENLQNRDRDVTNFNNTSGLAQPGNYQVSERPVNNGNDVIINNGVNGNVNFSKLYDTVVAARIADGIDPAKAATVQFADPYCTVPGTGGIYAGSSPFPLGACRFSYQQTNPIQPKTEILLTHTTASYTISGDHELFFEGRYYRQDSAREGIGSYPITTASSLIPASNPFNPFGVNAMFRGRVLGINASPKVDRVDIVGTHLVLGASGGLLGGDWRYTVNGTWSRETADSNVPDTDIGLLQNALNGFGGPDCQITPLGSPAGTEQPGEGNCVYFSPFGANQMDHDSRIFFNLLQPNLSSIEVEYQIVEFVITGDIFEMRGGMAGLALGGQSRREMRSVDVSASSQQGRWGFTGRRTSGSGVRTVDGVFAELYLPWLDNLDMQLALRYEDYGPFTTTDPKIGINWRATVNLAFRASASTAFRAPALAQSVGNAVTSSVGQTVDPLANPVDNGTFRVINTLANSGLKPEKSENINLGVTWQPMDNLSLSLDYWDFEFENQITLENVNQVILQAPSGPRLIRDELGQLLAVNIGYFNAGSTETNGLDFRVEYNMTLGSGHLISLKNSLSWINSYKVQVGPNAPVMEVVGRRNDNNPGYATPEFRNTTELSWDYASHSANLTMRYTDSVKDDVFLPITAKPTGEVDSWTVFDAQYAYRLGTDRRYQFTIGAINLLDEKPPEARFTGYLSSLTDALGRQIYLRVNLKI